MRTIRLQATMKNGAVVVGEFTKLGHIQRYVSQVFRGDKPFNAWQTVGTTHPVTGEPVLMRTRVMFNGPEILSIVQIDEAGSAVAEVQGGEVGRYTVPSPAPEGCPLPSGTIVPCHRDAATLRRFVIVDGSGTQFWLDQPVADTVLARDRFDDDGFDEGDDNDA
jgi:hypothetical protein